MGTVVNVCSRTNRARGGDMTYTAFEIVNGRTACSQEKQINGCVKTPEFTELLLWEIYDLFDPGERPSLRDRRGGFSKKF